MDNDLDGVDDSNEPALDESMSLNVSDQKAANEKNDMVIANFFVSIIWSIGITLRPSSKDKFNVFFLELCENSNTKYPK